MGGVWGGVEYLGGGRGGEGGLCVEASTQKKGFLKEGGGWEGGGWGGWVGGWKWGGLLCVFVWDDGGWKVLKY